MAASDERQNTFDRLDEDSRGALKLSFDYQKDKCIILSDVHKGDRESGSDDFQHNGTLYCCALQHYLESGFVLILAGDIEEGWECSLADVITGYRDTALEMERRFVEKGRYYRIYGNHDGDLACQDKVKQFLWPLFGQISVYPAVYLGDKIIVVHGHQGDPSADRGAWLSRSVVRFIWKPLQHVFKFMNNRAAENNKIRARRDQYLYEWANEKSLLLIAGHTHRGMFESYAKTFQLREKQHDLQGKLGAEIELAAKLLLQEAINRIDQIIADSKEELPDDKQVSRLGDKPVPCYFNTGCCVHTDGLTGIELDGGEIRFVKWALCDSTYDEHVGSRKRPDGLLSAERTIYQVGELAKIMERISRS